MQRVARIAVVLASVGIAAAQNKVRVADRPGTWVFAGQTTVEVHSKLFHGADFHTFLKVRWPQVGTRRPRHHRSEVASDAFGNKEPWCVLWREGEATLWIARGEMRAMGAVEQLPKLASIAKVELRDPEAVRVTRATGSGPQGLVPDDIRKALGEHLVVPVVNQQKPNVRSEKAQPDHVFELLCRARCVAADGRPVAGVAVRFSVVIPGESQRTAGTAPTNSGLPTSFAVSDEQGYAVALVPISELAYEHGAEVAPTVARGKAAPQPLPKLQRLARQQISAEQVRDLQLEHATDEAPRALRGTLVDERGAPIAGAEVAVGVARDGVAPSFPTIRRTDAAGRFRFDDLPQRGALQLVVRRDGRCVPLPSAPVPGKALPLQWLPGEAGAQPALRRRR